MCSISGIYSTSGERPSVREIGIMNESMVHRGPDASGIYVGDHVCLAHNRLAVIDPERGGQPMSITYRGREYIIVYNGELYNTPELRERLKLMGAEFTTRCDTEVVLWSYIFWKEHCASCFNGIYAFIVYDKAENKIFASRDRLGVKPLYYARRGDMIYFASEVKALLKCSAVAPKMDFVGLWQLLFLAPAKLSGREIFRDVKELKAGQNAVADRNGIRCYSYWSLEAKPFRDSAEQAKEITYSLLSDAVSRQLVSDVPVCTFLSGGLDSSVITSLASREMKERGEVLSTYSFEYEGDKNNFTTSLFQPERDDEYALSLAEYLGTDHKVLTAPQLTVAEYLEKAVRARDFPGQADIDSSLIWYCERVKLQHTVALSGECADEIFGGYPWFYRAEMLERDFFPWIHSPFARASLFRKEVIREGEGYAYMSRVYKDILDSAPLLEEDSDSMRTARRATILSTEFYMQHLLQRKDRMSMACSLEVRVPFADHRIIEYVYNVPWEIKYENNVEKALLRGAAAHGGLLPESHLYRKKSPYPKTRSPEYEEAVEQMLRGRLGRDDLFNFLADGERIRALLDNKGEDVTWFGQLMSRPQLIAWLYQLSYWLEIYNVELV